MDQPARRRARLARQLRDLGVDLFAVSHPVNVTYLTGFTGDSSWLLVGPKRAVIVSDGRYSQQIAEECPGLEAVIRPPDKLLLRAVSETVTSLKPRACAFESHHLTVADLESLRELVPAVEWAPHRGVVEKYRTVKDAGELGQIREAIHIAERAFEMFRAMMRPGATEKELADDLEGYVRRAGGRSTSFDPIVAAGDRSALPHYSPGDRVVSDAAFVLVDWGATGRLYRSDLTRVIGTGGAANGRKAGREKVESKLRKLYTVALHAQEAAFAAVRPGAKASAVDAAARKVIADAGYGFYFSHGLGHGIGIQIHEGPFLRANSTDVIEPGMVFTLEPGIYLPDWGGVRVEDDVLVTPDGAERLTSVPRDVDSMFEG